MKSLIRIIKENQGTSSIEMGLICTLIVLAMMSALQAFAHGTVNMWEDVSSKTATAISGSSN